MFDKLDTVKLEDIPRGANKMGNTIVSLVVTMGLGAKESKNVAI